MEMKQVTDFEVNIMQEYKYHHFAVMLIVSCLLCCLPAIGMPDPPGQVHDGKPVHEAYLFAHMTHHDYGRLYYSVSLDGLPDGFTRAAAYQTSKELDLDEIFTGEIPDVFTFAPKSVTTLVVQP